MHWSAVDTIPTSLRLFTYPETFVVHALTSFDIGTYLYVTRIVIPVLHNLLYEISKCHGKRCIAS